MMGKLSSFQRMMVLWNGLHPYNAVHVARIAKPLDEDRLARVIDGILERSGLTGLVVDAKGKRFHYRGGPAGTTVRSVPEQSSVEAALDAAVRDEINSPFSLEGGFTPFRFFALPAGDSFYLGLTYCHFVSDAVPIIAIMTGIARAYTGRADAGGRRPFDVYPDILRHIGPAVGRNILYWLLRYPKHAVNLCRSTRPHVDDRSDGANGLSSFEIPGERLENALALARSWGATLHDVFLAALAKGVAPLAAKRKKAKRDRFALSSIVSFRERLGGDLSRQFGVFLGNFLTFHRDPDGQSLERMSKDVARQTTEAKKHKLYLRTLMELRISAWIVPWFPLGWRHKLFLQTYPLWAGISNMSLDSLIDPSDQAIMPEYSRAVSTGPVCPLVLSVTTFNGSAKATVTYRTTAFTQEAVRTVVDGFRRCITDPCNP